MDYVIKNNKNVYIKLNENGRQVTCVESVKDVFEFFKAKNLLASLPKSLKRFYFYIETIPDITTKQKMKEIAIKKRIIYCQVKLKDGLKDLVFVMKL